MPILDKLKTRIYEFVERRTRPDMGEVGHSGWDPYQDYEMQPYNPDQLVQRKGLKVYDRMLTDDQVKVSLGIKKIALLKTGWDVEAASEDEQDLEIAEFAKWNLRQMQGAFEKDLREILSALSHGYSVTEILWRIIDRAPYEGRIGLHALKTRRPHGFQFEMDKHGNMEELRQNTTAGPSVPLDPAKFAIFVYGDQWGNPYGVSDLRAAYRAWWSKDFIIKAWNIFLDKWGQPTAVGKYPKGGEGDSKRMLQILDEIQTRTSITLPQELEVDLIEASRTGQAGYEQALDKYDKQIARALMIPELLGYVERDGGSFNLGEKQFELFGAIIEDLGRDVAESVINEQIIRPLVDFNWAVQDYPAFRFRSFFNEDPGAQAELLSKAEEAGYFHPRKLKKDADHARGKLGLPELDDDDMEQIASATPPPPPSPPASPVPPDGAGGGEEEDTREFAEGPPERELTVFEEKVDFEAIEQAADDAEEEAKKSLSAVMQKMRDKLEKRVEKEWPLSVEDIDDLQLQHVREFRTSLVEFLMAAFDRGREDGAAELRRAGVPDSVVQLAERPARDRNFIRRRAFYITGVERDHILQRAKQAMFQAIETGATLRDTEFELERIFQEYIEVPSDVKTPARLETIARTNFTNAYNAGRMEFFSSPGVDEFVPAVMYSAIIDERTTDFCRRWDGKTLSKDNPLYEEVSPPAHFNCRSTIVPVTTMELESEQAAGRTVPIDEGMPSIRPARGFGAPGRVDPVGAAFPRG